MTSVIRKAQQRDIAQITNIERDCFPNPWDASTFLTILVRQGMSIQEEGRILNIAVEHERRSKGLGKKLLSVTFNSMQENGITSCILEVRVSNEAARIFYEKMGMRASDRVHNYYEDEDAIIYRIDW